AELALEKRCGSATLGGNRVRRLCKEGVSLGRVARPRDRRLDREDLLLVVGLSLQLPVADERVELAIAHEGSLQTAGLALVDGQVEHVAAAEQFLCSHLIKDDARIHTARDRE